MKKTLDMGLFEIEWAWFFAQRYGAFFDTLLIFLYNSYSPRKV